MCLNKKAIKDWLRGIDDDSILLPDLQRKEVWKPELVENFLFAILDESPRPLGVFLVLEVTSSNVNEYVKKSIKGESIRNEKNCKMLVWDGQQRLTALWKSLNDKYDEKYYVEYEKKGNGYIVTGVKSEKKQKKDSKEVSDAIPVTYLKEDAFRERNRWLENHESTDEFKNFVTTLKNKIYDDESNIHFFEMPHKTSKEDMIDIFVEINTSSVRLSHYDLAIALIGKAEKKNLRKSIEEIEKQVPTIKNLEAPGKDPEDGSTNLGELILKIECLRQGFKPNYNSFIKEGKEKRLDFKKLVEGLKKITKGLKWTVELLKEIGIERGERLPSTVPLRVLPALEEYIPTTGTKANNALKLIRMYLWRAFLTDRYSKQVNARLYEDFKGLKEVLKKDIINIKSGNLKNKIPIFRCKKPSLEEMKKAPWPKGKSILGRGVLLACSLGKAKDIVTGESLHGKDKEHIEYHHIFPKDKTKSFYSEDKKNEGLENSPINCMLLTKDTNRNQWRNKLPGDFLEKAIEEAEKGNPHGKQDVDKHLKTHLLEPGDFECVKDIKGKDLKKKYEDFLKKRGGRILKRIKELLEGNLI